MNESTWWFFGANLAMLMLYFIVYDRSVLYALHAVFKSEFEDEVALGGALPFGRLLALGVFACLFLSPLANAVLLARSVYLKHRYGRIPELVSPERLAALNAPSAKSPMRLDR